MAKLPNHQLVKINRSYTVEETARRLDVHKTTVRRWLADGLPSVGGRGKTLLRGVDLRAFLEARRRLAKRPCPPGHLYCLKCRTPRIPACGLTEYVPITATSGNVKALCSECMTMMHRRTAEADLARMFPETAARLREAPMHLSKCNAPSLNADSQ